MKRFLVVFTILFFTINVFGQEVICDYNITSDSEDVVSLYDNGTFHDKKASGTLCITDKLSDNIIKYTKLNLKDGKLIRGVEIKVFDNNELIMKIESNNHNLFPTLLATVLYFDIDELSTLLENDTIIISAYEKNIVREKAVLNKDKGSSTTYYENGAMYSYIPSKNFKYNGIAEVYNEDGKLWSTITYKDDKIISAECADTIAARLRPGGLKWTKAEISNWENGLEVKCGP